MKEHEVQRAPVTTERDVWQSRFPSPGEAYLVLPDGSRHKLDASWTHPWYKPEVVTSVDFKYSESVTVHGIVRR